MNQKRRRFSAAEKTKVALEAIKSEFTIAEISTKYKVHATQINKWKKEALEHLATAFTNKLQVTTDDYEKQLACLYQQIGQLKVENDFLKKKGDMFGS